MFMGLTIANIGGVPLATWVGQNIGWRVSPCDFVLGILLCSLCGKHYRKVWLPKNQT
jgi:predicted MFS family arabinose efflux permease